MLDTSQIREQMEVVANDGAHVGTVDHLDGTDKIKLAKNDPASGGQHHWISIDQVNNVDDRVHLRCSAEEARRVQRNAE
jgi:hypothetical protein